MSDDELPATAGEIADDYPEVWSAFSALGAATADAGPLTNRERRLVKLALAIGTGSEGATHSHVRRAEDDGLTVADIEQVAVLAIPTLGFPRAAAAMSWIRDVTEPEEDD